MPAQHSALRFWPRPLQWCAEAVHLCSYSPHIALPRPRIWGKCVAALVFLDTIVFLVRRSCQR